MFNEKQWKRWNKNYVAAMILFYFSLAMIVLCAIYHPPYLPAPIAGILFSGSLMGFCWKQMKILILESTLDSELSIKEIRQEQNVLKDHIETLKPSDRNDGENPTIH